MKNSFQVAGVSLLALSLAIPPAFAKKDSLVISVFAKASDSYQRDYLLDGSLKPQTYVVGDGGIDGRPAAGGSVDGVDFPGVVRLLARKLAPQSFYPARNAKTADLLLIVSLGETVPYNDAYLKNAGANLSSSMNHLRAAENDVKLSELRGESQISIDGIQSPTRSVRDIARDDADTQMFETLMFEDLRMKANEDNARLLGYVDEINNRNNLSRFAGAGNYFNDLMSDLETGRYYVIVQAFDLQATMADGRRHLVWTTRISIPAAGSRFSQCLPAMLADASQYFGHNSGRLIRNYREGVVRLGELEVMGVATPAEAGANPVQEGAK